MAKWYKAVTQQGQTLLAQALATEAPLVITRAQCGSGVLDINGKTEEEIVAMLEATTEITDPVKFLPIVAKKSEANQTKVRVQLSNSDIEEKFRLSTLALWGRLGTETTDKIIKVYYTEEGDTIDPASVHPGYVAEYMAAVAVTNGTAVNVIVDAAGIVTTGTIKVYLEEYALKTEVEKDIKNAVTNHNGATDAHSELFKGKVDANKGDASNVIVNFSAATSRIALATGESLSALMGKIAKWLIDLGTAAFKNVAQANGVCELDDLGKVPENRIPDYSAFVISTTTPQATNKLWVDCSDGENYVLKCYHKGAWHPVNAVWG